ncbi:MAG: PspC domain-containing protein [Chloroflexi bacterium]|nr:PspC domain-containing protein [Chloroflexota bacterium]
MTQRLYRSQVDRMLTGVAGGMAEYLRVDPVIVRMLWVVAVFLSSGVGLLVYLALAIVMPTAPQLDDAVEAPDDASAQQAEGSQPSTPARHVAATNGAALVVGSALIIIGAAALMSQFGWFDAWRLWPLLLIAIGGLLIFNQRR